MKYQKYRAVICDLDGVVIRSADYYLTIFKKIANDLNVKLPRARLINRNLRPFPVKNILAIIFSGKVKEAERLWHKYGESRESEDQKKLKLIDGVDKTIKELRAKGYVAGCFTNRMRKRLRYLNGEVKNLLKEFNFIQTCKAKKVYARKDPYLGTVHITTTYSKPNPSNFRRLLQYLEQRYRISPDKVIFIGDELADGWSLLRNDDVKFIAVLSGAIKYKQDWKKILDIKNKDILPDITYLPDWLKKHG